MIDGSGLLADSFVVSLLGVVQLLPKGMLIPAILTAVGTALGMLAIVGKVPIQYNLRNLLVRWPTTLLIVVAFALVIGLLVAMLAFVNGMYKLTEGSGQPGNVIVLSEGTTEETFSNLGFSDIGDIENQPLIERYNNRPLVSRETYLVVNQPVENPQPNKPKRRFLQIRGIDEPEISGRVHALPLYPGSEWFSAAGVRENADHVAGTLRVPSETREDADGTRSVPTTVANSDARTLIEVVLGEGIAGALGGDRTPEQLAAAKNKTRLDVGDRLSLGGRTLVIVGVMQSGGSTFDSEIWAKRSLIGPLFGKNTYSSLVCRTADATAARALKEYYNTEFKKAAVLAQLETDYFSSLSETNQQFLYSIVFLAIIMSIGGVFGVMNTMFAAISQRSKDIGVLRIIGFRRWQVLTSFLLESLLLSLLGGLVGLAVGSLAHGWRASSIVGGQGGGKFVVLEMVVTLDTLGVGLILALTMGLMGGLVPAILAMWQRPLESLR